MRNERIFDDDSELLVHIRVSRGNGVSQRRAIETQTQYFREHKLVSTHRAAPDLANSV
jgi:hypothetical protein